MLSGFWQFRQGVGGLVESVLKKENLLMKIFFSENVD